MTHTAQRIAPPTMRELAEANDVVIAGRDEAKLERARSKTPALAARRNGGPIRMTRLALPLLEAAPQAGVLFISSAVALGAVPGLAVYAKAKAGAHSLARSLRAELAVLARLAPRLADRILARALGPAHAGSPS